MEMGCDASGAAVEEAADGKVSRDNPAAAVILESGDVGSARRGLRVARRCVYVSRAFVARRVSSSIAEVISGWAVLGLGECVGWK